MICIMNLVNDLSQDLAVNSDIDRIQSMYVDGQLYKKFDLSLEEIAFIENKIKLME